ncbi:Tad domain-containing protein [Bradyrhizobium sp. Ash2021]|uniref:Tad domain-containing protein n=1 Tax=Bradyrhizobium sp. Ash2021 TaxID=2954771 RepID=UPI002815B3E1|nr:Tad domain-containing protein [Bradyrhizobium sp. Ash2021]
MIFGIAVVPLISAMGCAVDYSMATRMRAKLQSAADAASVASLSKNSAGFTAAAAMTGDGSVTAGVTEANNVFDGNVGSITGYNNLTRTSTVTKTGIKLASSVTFSADVPTNFMRVVGFQKLTVTGVSKSSASLPPYLDFYLALDVSGSMGLPSTTAEAKRLQYLSPDNYAQYPTGCTLACHFSQQNGPCTDSGTQGYPTNGYCLGYLISRVSPSGYTNLLTLQSPQGKYLYKNQDQNSPLYNKYWQLPSTMVSGLPNSLNAALPPVSSCPTAGTDNCIQLRLDAVGFALNATVAANGVDGLLALAQKKKIVTNQFRIGLYPFIKDIDKSYAPLTSTINGSSTTPGTINYAAANLATELDTNLNVNLGSGGTHIDNALNSINNLIASVGNGSASNNTQPYVFLVTDGAQDNQYKDVPNGNWHGSNHATVLSDTVNAYPGICTTLKSRGIIVSVLYIPYQPINPVNTSFAGDEDDYANWNIGTATTGIAKSLSDCSSPADAAGSYFYTANTPADITAALNAMFNHAVTTAHITN